METFGGSEPAGRALEPAGRALELAAKGSEHAGNRVCESLGRDLDCSDKTDDKSIYNTLYIDGTYWANHLKVAYGPSAAVMAMLAMLDFCLTSLSCY